MSIDKYTYYIDEHTFLRLKQRKLIPRWLSKKTANQFVLQHKQHTLEEIKDETDPGLTKLVTPNMIIYERKGKAKTVIINKMKAGVAV